MPRTSNWTTLKKIVSGGQTGVDRGALDAALELGFPCGGYCPGGRLAEDGRIDDRYPLIEIPGGSYEDRTRKNVEESDGTLIISPGELTGGTKLTKEICENLGKPNCVLDSPKVSQETVDSCLAFIKEHRIEILNVAGPRRSEWSDGYKLVFLLFQRVIQRFEK